MSKLLIVVDMQNDFVTGVLGSEHAQKIIPNVIDKIKEYDANGDNILFTTDIHSDDEYNYTNEGKHVIPHCIRKTKGCELIPEILNMSFDRKFKIFSTVAETSKSFVSIFEKSTYGDITIYDQMSKNCKCNINNYAEIEIIGVATNICVLSTAMVIKFLTNDESLVTIDASCCASYDEKLHNIALDIMHSLNFKIINNV